MLVIPYHASTTFTRYKQIKETNDGIKSACQYFLLNLRQIDYKN